MRAQPTTMQYQSNGVAKLVKKLRRNEIEIDNRDLFECNVRVSLRNAIFIDITTKWFCFFYQTKSTKIPLRCSYINYVNSDNAYSLVIPKQQSCEICVGTSGVGIDKPRSGDILIRAQYKSISL